MEKNELKKVGGLVLVVMAALLLLHWLPATEVGGHALRRVDILADVRPPLVLADSAAACCQTCVCRYLSIGQGVHRRL